MKRLLLIPLIAVFACAHITQTVKCPASSTGVSFALAGSTVGNTVISMLSGALTKGGLLAATPMPEPGETGATMDYEYLPVFGADSGSLTCTSPPATPGVLVPGPPPSILH